jgi:DNA-binding CsgD family transcriptional regulator/5-methylcytosine-specific restriction endonuclease McrA
MSIRTRVAELLGEGLSLAEIARRLDVAGPTVAYHAQRLTLIESSADELSAPHDAAQVGRRQVETRDRVARLLSTGLSRGEIARRLGIGRSTVSYHARRLGAPVDARGARRYDWEAVQRYYDAGHSVRECQTRFGFSRQTWTAAVARGAVVPRPHALPLADLLVAGVYRGRRNLKERLVNAGLKDGSCESCGLHDWCGQQLTMALHHVNGDRHDNRIENLQLLCPNCHSQTHNFAGRRRPAA